MQILVNFAFSGTHCTSFPLAPKKYRHANRQSVFEFRLLYINIKIRAERLVSAPPLNSSALFGPHFPCPGSAEQLSRLLSAIHTPGSRSPSNISQPVPGESCPQVPLDLVTSGELKLLPYAGGALPGRPEKGLSCVCSM